MATEDVQFALLADHIPEFVMVLDHRMRVLFVNRPMREFFSMPADLPPDSPISHLSLPEELVKNIQFAANSAREAREARTFACDLERGTGLSPLSGMVIGGGGLGDQVRQVVVMVNRAGVGDTDQPGTPQGGPALVAHELRSALNAIKSWAHIIETQLPEPSAIVQRGLEGIRVGIAQQVGIIESYFESTPDSAAMISKTSNQYPPQRG